MSVVVRMKMPKEGCHTCDARCVSDLYGYICGIERKNVMPFLGKKNRPDWCPIICSLPEWHGRLVDEKSVRWAIDDIVLEIANRTGRVEMTKDETMEYINSLCTIVPSERSET